MANNLSKYQKQLRDDDRRQQQQEDGQGRQSGSYQRGNQDSNGRQQG